MIGDSSLYADYIFPDLSVWERWGTPHVTPDVPTKTSKVRQPVVGPIPETVKVFGEELPICMEAVMLAIAEKLGLPGYGPDGFGKGVPFTRPEDFYLKMVANLAAGDHEGDVVPDADDRELELFLKARKHLPKALFDPERWKRAVGERWWRKVVYVLNRGGRYENFRKAYDGDKLGHRFGGQFNLYAERAALARHSMTGERFSGLPHYEPVKDALGREVHDDENGYDLHLITYKEITGGHSRTLPTDYWLAGVLPENALLISARDARRLGLRDGDHAKLVSPTNPEGVWELGNGKRLPMVGRVKVIEGLRPGVVAVSWHFGHWAYGAGDAIVDGQLVPGDPRRRRGLCPNAAMRLDPVLKDVCLSDPIGGSASFYDTRVRVVRVSPEEAETARERVFALLS